jgi:hypothetical protein
VDAPAAAGSTQQQQQQQQLQALLPHLQRSHLDEALRRVKARTATEIGAPQVDIHTRWPSASCVVPRHAPTWHHDALTPRTCQRAPPRHARSTHCPALLHVCSCVRACIRCPMCRGATWGAWRA